VSGRVGRRLGLAPRRVVYALLGVGVLGLAGFMINQALNTSLVYFILPNEYAREPSQFENRRIRLGGLVAPDSVAFNDQRRCSSPSSSPTGSRATASSTSAPRRSSSARTPAW
jgi:hypothetical protein